MTADKQNDYYIKVDEITNIDEFLPEFELWLNSDFNFLLTWEKIYNDENFEFDSNNYISIDSWIDSNSLSIIKKENHLYLHPHILLAFSIQEPIIKVNLITAIFSLPQEVVNTLLLDIFDVNEEDDKSETIK